jgi:hypothetical protein
MKMCSKMLSGLSPRMCPNRSKALPENFDTSPEALKKLQPQGVPEALILAMFHAKKRKST